MNDLDDVDWRALANEGTVDELVRWGDEYHHIDLTDTTSFSPSPPTPSSKGAGGTTPN